MRRSMALVLLLSCLGAVPARADDALIETALPLLSDLAARSGFGVHPYERGAFLVQAADGSIRCELWPFTNEHNRIRTSLEIPPGAIATVHTHPKSQPRPSDADRREAARLALPMLVVSRDSLHLIDDQGVVAASRSGISWRRHPRRHCSEPSQQTANHERASASRPLM